MFLIEWDLPRDTHVYTLVFVGFLHNLLFYLDENYYCIKIYPILFRFFRYLYTHEYNNMLNLLNGSCPFKEIN